MVYFCYMSTLTSYPKTGHTFQEYIDLPGPDSPWLVEPLLPASGLGILAGPPKSKKSYLTLQLAIDLAHGRPWMGFRTNPCRVYYIQVDTPRSLWQLRCRRLQKQGVTLDPDAMQRLKMVDRVDLPAAFDIKLPSTVQWLQRQIAEHRPDIVIFDTMSKSHSGDEDSRNEMEVIMEAFRSAVAPAAILFVNHVRKAKADFDGGVVNEIRGSSAVMGGVDILMRLHRPTKKRSAHLLEYEGRATENGALELHSAKNLFFYVDPEAHWQRLLYATLMEDHPSRSAAGRALHAKAAEIGILKSEDTCRKAIERAEND